jgi:cytochrome P450
MLAETNLFMETLPLEEPIDISKAMMRLTFKVVSRSLFSAGLQEKDLDRIDFIITELQHYVITQARQPYLIPWLILSGKRRYYARLKAEADKILFGIIESRRQSGEQNDDLLNMLLESRYEDTGEGMSDLQLKDESLILFVAGHETSANALAWTWYLLSRHPEVERKLLEEVLEVLGERDVTFEDLHRLPYTLQVIQESMRLFPPAWAIDRQAIEEDVAGGFRIPKGSIVLLFLYGVHHSPDLWEDPERFDPDRFAGEGMKNRSDFTYFPFGGGPRLCIGNQFALMEMQVVLAQMIRKFRFELLEGQLIEGQPLITFRPKYGIRMRLKARMPQDAVLKA